MTNKPIVVRLNEFAAILHASAAWGSDELGILLNEAADSVGAINIGTFRLRECPEKGKICIERIACDTAGEGGHFSIEAVEQLIAKFYADNF